VRDYLDWVRCLSSAESPESGGCSGLTSRTVGRTALSDLQLPLVRRCKQLSDWGLHKTVGVSANEVTLTTEGRTELNRTAALVGFDHRGELVRPAGSMASRAIARRTSVSS